VCENRPEALDNFAPQLRSNVTLLRQFPAKFIEDGGCHANTAIVALTHDPRMDDLTLMEAIHTPAFYIGAMGSLRNSARRRQRLQQIAEFSPQELERIHAPIGLPLGSKTPAEIALAVMADIVQQKNRTTTARTLNQGELQAPDAGAQDATPRPIHSGLTHLRRTKS